MKATGNSKWDSNEGRPLHSHCASVGSFLVLGNKAATLFTSSHPVVLTIQSAGVSGPKLNYSEELNQLCLSSVASPDVGRVCSELESQS